MRYWQLALLLSLLLLSAAVLPPAQACCLSAQSAALDADQTEQLNTFLSNFSEVQLPTFTRGTLTEQELIRFGLLHTWANNPKLISRCSGAETIPAAAVEAAVTKYFDLVITQHQSASPDSSYYFEYRDGWYYRTPSFFPEFAGQRFAARIYFTQITGLQHDGDDFYTAFGDIYVKDPQSVDFHSIYRPLALWDKRMLADIQKIRPVKATLQQTRQTDGSARYILIDYTLI